MSVAHALGAPSQPLVDDVPCLDVSGKLRPGGATGPLRAGRHATGASGDRG